MLFLPWKSVFTRSIFLRSLLFFTCTLIIWTAQEYIDDATVGSVNLEEGTLELITGETVSGVDAGTLEALNGTDVGAINCRV